MEKEGIEPGEITFGQADTYRKLGQEESPPSALKDLKSLRREKYGLKTSLGELFGGPNDEWARDLSIASLDLLEENPEIAEEAALMLSARQGVRNNWRSGEEPGRIMTEHREIFNNPKLPLYKKLGLSLVSSFLWQTGIREYTTYFSSDTTPLFIRLVSQVGKKKPEILDSKVFKKDGSEDTLLGALEKSSDWIVNRVDDEGIIEIQEKNPFGNQFRYWRDSPSSYRDEKGGAPNIFGPMAIIDVQGLSADALERAALILRARSPLPEKSEDFTPEMIKNVAKADLYEKTAQKIVHATIKRFWLEKERYFASMIDRNEKGEERVIKTIQANPGWLLNTSFFDDLKPEEKKKYLGSIVKELFSDDFLTDAGIRARSKKHLHDRKFADYHGSWVSWPVESDVIAKGLRRQGFARLASQIEQRVLNTVNQSGNNYEFFVVDEKNRIVFNPSIKKKGIPLPLEMKPEETIGWTVSAILRLKRERSENFNQREEEQEAWKKELEDKLLTKVELKPIFKTRAEITQNKPKESDMVLSGWRGFSAAARNVGTEILPKAARENLRRKKPKPTN